MLPKPEKTKKINHNLLEDSRITQESEEVLAKKRTQTKRRLVLVSLICTAGISLIFWTVRSVQKFIDSPPSFKPEFKFNIPKFEFQNSSSKTNLSDTEIKKMIGSKNWSVAVAFVSSPSNIIFQSNNSSNIDQIISDLSKIKTSSESLIGLNLPQGLLFQEKIDSVDKINYQNLISLPSDKIIIFISTDSNSLENVKPEIVSLVDALYWYSVAYLK